MKHIQVWGALVALAFVTPYALAITAPGVESDVQAVASLPEAQTTGPPSGLGSTDPWIDANGDMMFGDLDMQLNGILINGQRLESPVADQLTFNGKHLCVKGGGICGGTVTHVGTGQGLVGGPISTTGTIGIATGGVSNALLANGAVTAAKIGEPCASGQILKRSASAWACGTDVDTDTTYTAGSGLSLLDTTFSIPSGAVTSAMVQDGGIAAADIGTGAVTSAKLANGAVGTLALADGAATSAKIQDGGIGSADLAASSVGSTHLQQGSVGMRELTLVAGTASTVTGVTLANPKTYVYPPGATFTPTVSGSCLVSVTAQINSNYANLYSGPPYRIAIKRGTVNGDDGQVSQSFPSMESGGHTPSMTRTSIIPVTAGEATQFGGYFGFLYPDWVDDRAEVQVSWICF